MGFWKDLKRGWKLQELNDLRMELVLEEVEEEIYERITIDKQYQLDNYIDIKKKTTLLRSKIKDLEAWEDTND